MKKQQARKPATERSKGEFLALVENAFTTSVAVSGWKVDSGDLATWMAVLGKGKLPPDWRDRRRWYVALTESIAHMAIALSGSVKPDENGDRRIDRVALFLAAVLVSNSCQVERGKPCSGVTVSGFEERADREGIVSLYKECYQSSGLPLRE